MGADGAVARQPLEASFDRDALLAPYGLLDSPREPEFDDLVRAAAAMCRTPMALMNLVASDRQFFKAEYGLGVQTMPIETSFCRVVLDGSEACVDAETDLVIVPDAAKDPRFADNPLVTGEPGLRFYASVVLRTPDGAPIGTLGVCDLRPRDLDDDEREGLRALARQANRLLASRLATETARREERLRRQIVEAAIDHAIVATDPDGTIRSWNVGAVNIMGWSAEEAIGRHVSLFFTERDVAAERPRVEMAEALRTGVAVDERWHLRKDGSEFWGDGRLMPLKGDDGEPEGFVKILRDRTENRRLRLELETTRDRLHAAFASSDLLGHWELDIANDRVFADETAARMLGLPVELAERGAARDVFMEAVHEDDRARVRQEFERQIEQGDVIDLSYRLNEKGGVARHSVANGRVERDASGAPVRVVGVIMDVTATVERERRQNALLRFTDEVRDGTTSAEIASLAHAILGETLGASRVGFGDVHAGDGTTLIDIEADWTAPGHASVAGRHDFSNFGALIDDLHRGEMTVTADIEEDPRTGDAAANFLGLGVRSLVNVPVMAGRRLAAVLFVHDDRVRHWSAGERAFIQAMCDRLYAAIERHRLQEERLTLSEEIVHRMKNTVSVVQGIATQTIARAPDLASARQQVAERLGAYARAQGLLLRHDWARMPAEEAVRDALAPYEADAPRISVAGPNVSLDPQRILGLSLALHELATNAIKHGALSNDAGANAGRVEIAWSVGDAPDGDGNDFSLRWHEHDGPAVTPPRRRGFGTTILTTVTPGYFDGHATLEHRPDGLRYELHGSLAS